MDLWLAAVLGVVQGLTEFIPVSSTGHLRIIPSLLGQDDPGPAFSAVIQLGTLVAVIGFFAKDFFVTMPRAFFTQGAQGRASYEGRLPIYLVLGTLPIAVTGLTMKDYITGDLRSLYVVASMLIVVGVVFFFAEGMGRKTRSAVSITLSDAMLIGLAQTCALVPGVSRSGATIACALFLGLRRDDAAKFSFLLGVPAIAGAGIFELPDAISDLGSDAWLAVAIGTTTAAISGYLAIGWLMRFLGKRSLASFGVYRIAFGLLILALCIGGLLEPRS